MCAGTISTGNSGMRIMGVHGKQETAKRARQSLDASADMKLIGMVSLICIGKVIVIHSNLTKLSEPR